MDRLEFASSCAEPVGSDTSCFSWRCCSSLCLCRCSFESACAGVAFVTRICATLCDFAGAWRPERLRSAASAGGGVTASPLDSVPTLPLELCEPQRELPTVAGCTFAPCARVRVSVTNTSHGSYLLTCAPGFGTHLRRPLLAPYQLAQRRLLEQRGA